MAEWDIPNWTSLIVEIGVAVFAVFISWKFYQRGKKDQKEYADKTNNTLEEMKSMVAEEKSMIDEEKALRDNRREHFKKQLQRICRGLVYYSKHRGTGSKTPILDSDKTLFRINYDLKKLLDEHTDILKSNEKDEIYSLEELIEREIRLFNKLEKPSVYSIQRGLDRLNKFFNLNLELSDSSHN